MQASMTFSTVFFFLHYERHLGTLCENSDFEKFSFGWATLLMPATLASLRNKKIAEIMLTQLAFTCSKLATETPEQSMKSN